jgi:AraC-like DNA-binding protein
VRRISKNDDAMKAMKKGLPHICRVLGSPWPGVFGTDIDSARLYDRHWHTTFGFGLMERGAHRSMSGRGIVDAQVGEVITTNPGEVHDGRPLGGASRRWRMIYLDPAVMVAMVSQPGTPAVDVRLTRPVIRDATLIPVLRQLLARLEHWSAGAHRTPDAALGCEEALVRTCGLLLRGHSTATPTVEARGDVAQVRDRLADDLGSTASLSELAAIVGLSRYQLLRRFERVYGLAPFEWQRQVRAERARALIGTGSSLAQVAVDCGFADQSHMTRAFVSHFGFTPGAWAAGFRTRRA